jgi:SAM-dependent methyltransferase
MSENVAFRLLEKPLLYRLTQAVLAPGADHLVQGYIRELLEELPAGQHQAQCALPHIDIGCGPSSWLWQVDLRPVGVDISFAYSSQYHKYGEPATTASAEALPFASYSFEAVWSIGMLHHLNDRLFQKSIREFFRLCRPKGTIVLIDAVLPKSVLRNPIAYAIRRSDRGRYVRSQADFEKLLPDRSKWSVTRRRYSYTGLEILICWRVVD